VVGEPGVVGSLGDLGALGALKAALRALQLRRLQIFLRKPHQATTAFQSKLQTKMLQRKRNRKRDPKAETATANKNVNKGLGAKTNLYTNTIPKYLLLKVVYLCEIHQNNEVPFAFLNTFRTNLFYKSDVLLPFIFHRFLLKV